MDEQGQIDLGTGILEKQGTTTTSLGDMYGYAVFSDEFESKISSVKEKEKEELNNTISAVFLNEKVDTIETSYRAVMSAETATVVKEDLETSEAGTESILSIVGFLLLGAVVTTGVWLLIEKFRRRRKANADKNNSIG